MRKTVGFVLLAAMGCGAGDEEAADAPRVLASKATPDADRRPDPPWVVSTLSFAPATDAPTDEDRVQIGVAVDGPLTLGVPSTRVAATLDEVDRRLRKRTDGDRFEDGLLASRPRVVLEVAPGTPWRHALAVLRSCEVWGHRRVSLGVGRRRVEFHLPRNSSDPPGVPDGACVPVMLWLSSATSTATVRCAGRWTDLGSFRTRIGAIAKRVARRPVVAELDIGRDVAADDVVRFFEVLAEAGVRHFIEMSPPPPR